jgi:CubicO group peptidase (beta-lactamase class C family)
LDAVLAKTAGRSAVVALYRGRIVGSAGRNADFATPLHLASVSKTITAAAVMRLAERGDIDLAKPIGTYLDDFFAGRNDEIAAQPVSAFLNHASGLASNNLRAVTNGLTTWQQYASQAGSGRLSAATGRYLYSNDNYVLLTKLVVEVTDVPFSVAVRDLVWGPLGVDGGRLDVMTRGTQVLGGSGAWVASPRDVAVLFDALNPDSPGVKLLSPRWLSRLHAVAYSAEYRNGLRYRGDAWGHTGSVYAVRSAAVVTKSGTVYVVLSQGASPSKSERLFDALARLG